MNVSAPRLVRQVCLKKLKGVVETMTDASIVSLRYYLERQLASLLSDNCLEQGTSLDESIKLSFDKTEMSQQISALHEAVKHLNMHYLTAVSEGN